MIPNCVQKVRAKAFVLRVIENGLITLTLKLRSTAVFQRFSGEIDQMSSQDG